MKSLKTLLSVCLIVGLSQSLTAQKATIKAKISGHFNHFEGKVTQNKISRLLASLVQLSSKDSNMCFISIADYNDCIDNAATVYPMLKRYLLDLIGKEVKVTEIKALRPWEDEDYYTLAFEIVYENDNPDYPTEYNFDTIDLGIQNNCIKDIMHTRQWFGLSAYVKD
jgi:hypothetical protein